MEMQPCERTGLRLLPASPPDIIRGAQKDDIYFKQLLEGCLDLSQTVLGVFPALQHEREVRLLAQLLYHGLTTGCGLQTLGEEYCNVLQVTDLVLISGDGQLPSVPRRAALVLLQSLGPYLAERASSALDALGTACEDGGRCEAPGQQPSHCGRGGLSCGPGSSVEDASRLGGISGLRDDPAPGRVAGVRAWAALRAWQARQWLAATWGPALFIGARALSTHGMRLHLALFYLWGVFYQLPLRLAGVRFASIARPLQQRTSYWTLGAILLCHLALNAALHLRKVALHASGQVLGDAYGPGGVVSHAKMLETSGPEDLEALPKGGPQHQSHRRVQDKNVREEGMNVQPQVPPSSRQCPLCLSSRTNPTSTPCGHVFCWACIAQWCGEKPECPLCRARALQAQLVPLYHSSLF